MCGINGILKKSDDISIRIKNMNKSLEHRGPDSEGLFVDESYGLALGHRRLSIIDINNRSSQPMISNSGRWVLVFNGEIYNYLELKNKTRYIYNTNSDTEVILAYLECFGIEKLLDESNGMFAFAAYDKLKHNLYLCRDRFGIKPLFYYMEENMLVFSSEIKGILWSGLVEAYLDEESIDDYLGYRYVREPYTFFKKIYQVPAGSYIVIDEKLKKYIKFYWKLPKTFNFEQKYDEQRIKQEFLVQLKDSTMKRMVSDVPLGTYLSGGVDSSLLTAIVAENTNERLHTFTIGFSELNEFEYSNLVAQKYKTVHHQINIGADTYLENMLNVIKYKDAPLGVPNEIALALMSQELKKYITVVISGEGADELLGGYGRIYRSPFEYSNRNDQIDFYDFFINKYEYVPRHIRDELLNVSIKRRNEYDKEIRALFSENKNEQNVFDFFYKYHIKGLLQRLDTTTMLASVEARVPFLDHRLVEYTFKYVPYEMKLRWNSMEDEYRSKGIEASKFSEIYDTPKYLLREIAKDYIPTEVIRRKKMGFPIPLVCWDKQLKKMVYERLEGSTWLKKDGAFQLVRQCEKCMNGSQWMWMFINLGMFIDTYFTRKWIY